MSAAEPTKPAQAPVSAAPDAAANPAGATDELGALLANKAPDCSGGPTLQSGNNIWVGCGWAVLRVERTPEGLALGERRATTGKVVGFFEQDARVWVRLVQERAEVLSDSNGGPAAPSLAPAPQLEQPPAAVLPQAPVHSPRAEAAQVRALVGQVVSIDELDVTVNLGESDGVSTGSRVAITPPAGDARAKSARSTIGRVIEAEAGRATVRLGVNENVQVGDEVTLTEDPVTASRVAPQRAIGHWELRGMLRPMLNLGAFGGGVLAELDAGHRSRYFHYGVNLWPIGIATSSGDDALSTWSTYVYGEFDSWIFAAGLGLGAQSVNDTDFMTDAGSGLSLIQMLRVGAVDGLHLSARTRAVVFHSQTEFSGLEMQGQISVASDSWLIFRGGGGTLGYGFGEVAVRNLLQGNGQKDSLFLEVSVGGAGVYREACPQGDFITVDDECESHTVGGPLIGLGAEWRL